MINLTGILTDKQIEYLRPAERFAFENVTFIKIRNFQGAGKYLETCYNSLQTAVEAAKEIERNKTGRPMLYAGAVDTAGLECFCFLPIDTRSAKC